MSIAKYFIGPYLSCFFTVYGRDSSNKIWTVYDKPMTEDEANKAKEQLERANHGLNEHNNIR